MSFQRPNFHLTIFSDYARRNIEIPAEIKLKTGKQVSHYENGKIVNSTVLFSSNSIPLEPLGLAFKKF